MTKLLTQRAQELRQLGWTDEGANRYAAISQETQINLDDFHLAFVLGIALISISFIVLIVMSMKFYSSSKKNISQQPLLVGTNTTSIDSNVSSSNEDLNIDDNDILLMNNLYEFKKSPLDYFLYFFTKNIVDTDKLIIHFIMVASIFIDALKYSWKILKIGKNDNLVTKNSNLDNALNHRSDEELRSLLEGINLMDKLDRNQLLNLIKTNKNVLSKLSYQERTRELSQMKNSELRSLLIGVEKISRLNKSKLIEKILLIEFENL